jgi:hypothetical protein
MLKPEANLRDGTPHTEMSPLEFTQRQLNCRFVAV